MDDHVQRQEEQVKMLRAKGQARRVCGCVWRMLRLLGARRFLVSERKKSAFGSATNETHP